MIKLYRMKGEYSRQNWYTNDVFELDYIYNDRYMTNFGTDCTWINFRTKEKINIWDRCMRIITEEESKSLVREYNLEKLGI
jgi:hypothetical protein